MKPGEVSPEEMSAAQDDLGAFARMVGRELMPWQLAALRLVTWMTCLVAPRQCGKSFSLAVLACWWAFRRPGQKVLVVSSVESSALRLLEAVREVASHPMLAGSVDDDYKTRVTLSNGSRIESVNATQKQIRGASIDLLVIDEAAWIDDQVLGAAAIPTTAARPEARVVVASAPWASSGVFYDWAMDGLDPGNEVNQTFTWSLGMAPWIVPQVIEAARRTLPRAQFEAEYEGKWMGAGNAFFPAADLAACTADFPMIRGAGTPAVIALDWGRQRDRHAIVVAGLAEDFGQNGRPTVVVPYCETSRRDWDSQFAEVACIAGGWSAAIRSETNGPGGPATELLRKHTRTPVTGVYSGQRDKADAYARLAILFEQRAILIPNHAELLKQLGGIVSKPTPGGGFRIEARTESIHDDLPDALAMAVAGLPAQLADVPVREVPAGTQWLETPGGIRLPLPVTTIRAEAAYDVIYGGLWYCPVCQFPVPSRRETCSQQGCAGRNPDWKAPPLASAPARSAAPAAVVSADGTDPESVPIQNYASPHMRECLRCGHRFDGSFLEQCPRCHPRGPGGGRGPFPGGGMPSGLAGRLGPFLGPRR